MVKGELIGRERTADVFLWGEDRIIKLFTKDIPEKSIEDEFKISCFTNDYGITTPYAGGILQIEGRKGIVYERINGVSMGWILTLHPLKAKAEGYKFAKLHYNINKATISGIRNLKEQIISLTERTTLSVKEKKEIIEYTRKLSEGNKLCHGDFQPDRVIVTRNNSFIVDWSNGVIGNPAFDVAMTSLILSYCTPIHKEGPIKGKLLDYSRKTFLKEYIKAYVGFSNISYEEIESWMLPAAAVRLSLELPEKEKKELYNLIIQKLKN